MTDDLEVRELRYFRAVAEELNFSRAAERLGMAQPPLSRAIRQLERRLGVPLFERTTHHVTLTPAGLTLLEESARVLDAINAAARRTRRAAQPAPRLIVTAKPGVATDLLRRILDTYAAQSDAPATEIALSGFGEQATMVRDGRADLAIVGSPFDHEGLEIEPLLSEPRVAALPRPPRTRPPHHPELPRPRRPPHSPLPLIQRSDIRLLVRPRHRLGSYGRGPDRTHRLRQRPTPRSRRTRPGRRADPPLPRPAERPRRHRLPPRG